MTTSPQPDVTSLRWRKSSHSGSGNNCVEFASMATAVAVRDSKNPDGGHLVFGAHAWEAFITGIKRGEYESL
jgi:Domain of unknown function (DUF397)